MSDFTYIPTDRFEELDRIDLDGVFDVLDIYCQNMLPDMEACLVFLSRILRHGDAASHPKTQNWLGHLVRKAAAFGPLNLHSLGLAHQLTGDPELAARLERLQQFEMEPNLMKLLTVQSDPAARDRKRQRLLDELEQLPGHILVASQLLQMDYYLGIEHGDWLERFTVPKFFREVWDQRMFLHLAGLGADEEALALWAKLSQRPLCEVQLNLAAELHVRAGDTGTALDYYRQSVEMDPNQKPVRLRMAQLESPFVPDVSLPGKGDVCICLYTWNKADDLEKTLTSLAGTNIGPAKIRVLLNGCTDRSAEVVEAARALFPDNDFDVIALDVNVGAPAARNWLGAQPEVRQSEFVAYLDDDVELPEDWLAYFLTVMDRHPGTSAVGCKVVHGSEPRMIQYMHRRFTLAQKGMIKLTEGCQIAQMDCGQYDYLCETDTVMGCCHLLRMAHMPDGPQFDLRYSPSQVDDIVHDIELRLRGGEVRYCGLVKCIHHQNTGGSFQRRMTPAQIGQVLGNDVKFYYYLSQRLEDIRELMEKS